jgi:hypothetical protein
MVFRRTPRFREMKIRIPLEVFTAYGNLDAHQSVAATIKQQQLIRGGGGAGDMIISLSTSQ